MSQAPLVYQPHPLYKPESIITPAHYCHTRVSTVTQRALGYTATPESVQLHSGHWVILPHQSQYSYTTGTGLYCHPRVSTVTQRTLGYTATPESVQLHSGHWVILPHQSQYSYTTGTGLNCHTKVSTVTQRALG